MQTAKATLRIASSAETALEKALCELDEKSTYSAGRATERLAAACSAARKALAGIAPGERPLPWLKFARTMRTDEQVQACYSRAGGRLLAPTAQPLPTELIHTSVQLFRELSAIYACEMTEPEMSSPEEQERCDPALRLARALWCLGVSAKWTYFMQVKSDATLWRTCHTLYRRAESMEIAHRKLSLYDEPELGALTCADIYVHTLLLGMLNAGSLSARQLEIAHQWLLKFVQGVSAEMGPGGSAQSFHVHMDSEHGLEAGIPVGKAPAALRYIDIAPVHARLIESRENLRRGHVDLGDANLQPAVLDYGAFLDLAERFWSPSSVNIQERASRTQATAQAIDIVVGLDSLIQSIATAANSTVGATEGGAAELALLEGDTARPAVRAINCTLKDRSESGAGLLMPGASAAPAIGTLIGFRDSRSGQWEVGVLVRRLAEPEANQTLLGIKGISDHPIIVTLRHWKPATAPSANATAGFTAIFAPMDGRRNRADSLILSEATYSIGKNFIVPAGDATFHVRLNRVLERGDGWLRAGYQVMSKKK